MSRRSSPSFTGGRRVVRGQRVPGGSDRPRPAAGDADTVERLVLLICNPVMASGRTDTVRRWMEWFEIKDLIERYPGVAVTGALQFAIDGLPAATERWADAAEATSTTGVLSDGSTVEAMLCFLRANLCRHGTEAMRRDAEQALRGFSPASSFRANMIQVEGLSHLLEGDTEHADRFFAHAVEKRSVCTCHPSSLSCSPTAAVRRSTGVTWRRPARSPIRP